MYCLLITVSLDRVCVYNMMVSVDRVCVYNMMVSVDRVCVYNMMVSVDRVCVYNMMVSVDRVCVYNMRYVCIYECSIQDAITYIHAYACLMFSLPSHPHTPPSIMYMYTLAISIGYMDWETGCCYVWIQIRHMHGRLWSLPLHDRWKTHLIRSTTTIE